MSWGRTFENILLEHDREKERGWECVYVHRKYELSLNVDDK